MYTLGLNAAFHDPAACLVCDGVVVAAAEEERFTRIKHGKRPLPFSTWELPFNAVDYVLREGGIGLADVDHVAYSFDPWLLLGDHSDGHITLPLEPSAHPVPEEWEAAVAFNLALPGALVSAALPGMRSRRWGRILLLGGTRTDGIRGFRTNAAYAAAKTGLGVLAKSIALEYARDGIAALVLCPGFVRTEYLTPEALEGLAAKTPGGRLTDPGDFGDLAADLLCRDPPLWNGGILTADEGLAAW